MDKDGVKGLWSVSGVPFQVVELNSDGGLDSRFRGNDGLMTVIPPKLERYLVSGQGLSIICLNQPFGLARDRDFQD